MRCHRLTFSLFALLFMGGCQSIGFYTQATVGQSALLWHSRPISKVIADPQTPIELRDRLVVVESIRGYGEKTLALPSGHSYQRYTDIGRDYVMWNVVAAAEFSVEPELFCHPVVGCVAYQGYFNQADALAFADRLASQGLETTVAPVAAYSTLGWLPDPLLSSVLDYPDADLAALVFHELAHERFYLVNETTFNESFATFVARKGTRRWLADTNRHVDVLHFEKSESQRDALVALIRKTRCALAVLYAGNLSDGDKRSQKKTLIDQLRADYEQMRQAGMVSNWGNWFDKDLNNAKLVSIGSYYDQVGLFAQLFEEARGDFGVFYEQVEQLGDESGWTREPRRLCADRRSARPVIFGRSGPGTPVMHSGFC